MFKSAMPCSFIISIRFFKKGRLASSASESVLERARFLSKRDAYGRSLRYRRSGKLRVTHIIDGSTQYAGINYKDKNYSVVVGDSIAGGVVKWIDKEKVIIYKDGQELPYPVSGLTVEE